MVNMKKTVALLLVLVCAGFALSGSAYAAGKHHKKHHHHHHAAA
jgi:hypothetical protein